MGIGSSGQRPDSSGKWRKQRRGQTTLDFAIGISIFLAVLLFIFLFLPGILSPFTESAQEETIASNRVADKLASGMLASPSEPYVLDRHCTVQFFAAPDEGDQDPNDIPAGCTYDSGTLEEQVGVAESRERVRVSIRGDISSFGSSDILCWDDQTDDVETEETGLVEKAEAEDDSSDDLTCDVQLTRGEPPSTQDSITSVRTVSLADTDVSLYVEVW